jgi:hypothetical protein
MNVNCFSQVAFHHLELADLMVAATDPAWRRRRGMASAIQLRRKLPPPCHASTSPSFFALATSAALLSTASATVISGSVTTGSGSFIKLAVPFNQSTPDNTVGNNNFQNTNLYAFDEIQNINGNVPIVVDIGGVIPANTVVASH